MEKKGVSAEKRVTDRVHPGIFCAHESVSYGDRRWLGVKRFQQFR